MSYSAICNLYSIKTEQNAISPLFRVVIAAAAKFGSPPVTKIRNTSLARLIETVDRAPHEFVVKRRAEARRWHLRTVPS